jgi:hypothetical protein
VQVAASSKREARPPPEPFGSTVEVVPSLVSTRAPGASSSSLQAASSAPRLTLPKPASACRRLSPLTG